MVSRDNVLCALASAENAFAKRPNSLSGNGLEAAVQAGGADVKERSSRDCSLEKGARPRNGDGGKGVSLAELVLVAKVPR